jgi:hypothetical protein
MDGGKTGFDMVVASRKTGERIQIISSGHFNYIRILGVAIVYPDSLTPLQMSWMAGRGQRRSSQRTTARRIAAAHATEKSQRGGHQCSSFAGATDT